MNPFTMRFLSRANLGVILAIYSAFSVAAPDDCPLDASRLPSHSATGDPCADIGKIGLIKLAIPRNYITGPDFVYQGVDIWDETSYKNRPKKQSFDLEIKYFTIRVRLSNLKPIESEKDKEDFNRSEHSVMTLPPIENQWIYIQFNNARSSEKENRLADMQDSLQRFTHQDSGTNKITFIKQKNNINGMEHYTSPIQPSIDTIVGQTNEVFYDAKENQSIITCGNIIRHVPPYDPLSFCHHYFYTAAGDVAIDVYNIRDKNYYLSHWQEIKKMILANFDSFVIEK